MKHIGLVSRYLFLFALLCVGITQISLVGVSFYSRSRPNTIAVAPPHFEPLSETNVLGTSDGSLAFETTRNGSSNGGVIVMSAAEQPIIELSSYQVSGTGKFSLYPVSRDDLLNYLVYKKNSDPEAYNPNEKVFHIDENTLTGKKTFEQEIHSTSNSNQNNSFSLPVEGTGIWFLRGEISGSNVETMIVRSNLGGIVHEGDNENVFWVQDTSYSSVADVTVDVYNSENSISKLDTIVTNQDGIATDAVNGAADFALMSKGNDLTLLPINLQNLAYRQSSFGRYATSFSKRVPDTSSFLFTDRFLYKPGDTVYFKDIIRADDDADFSIKARNVTVAFGTYGEPSVEKNMIVSADGSVDGNFVIPKDSKAGYYALTIKDGDTYLGAVDLQVASFRKPDSSVSVSTDKLTYFPGENMKLSLSGESFMGQPLSGSKIRYKVYSSKAGINGDYTTIRYVQGVSGYRPSGTPDSSGETIFDSKGTAFVSMPVVNATGYRQFWVIHIEYLDQSGNTSDDAVQALVQPADFSIESGEDRGQILMGKPALFPMKLVKNKADAEIANVSVQASLFVSNTSGTYSLEQSGLEAKSGPDGVVRLPFTPKQKQSYRLDFSAKDLHGNPSRAEDFFYASDILNDSSGSPDIFTVTTDKKTYEVGETVRVTIQTLPTIHNIFVSLGRSYSREHRVLAVNNGTASFETVVKEKYQPNFFFDVGSFSKDQWIHEQEKVIVNTDDKKVTVKITPSKAVYGPGEKASFDIQTIDGKGRPVKTDLAFWVFDKALLALHGNYFEGIFTRFWSERYFSIPTNFSYQGIMNNGAEGGGGCFSGDTPITMANGTQKSISQVKAGDKIRTFASLQTKETVDAPVVATHTVTVDGYLILNTTLKLTPEHKILVNGQWKTAGDAQVGDTLLAQDGTAIKITSIEWVRGKTQVYNLQVEKFHTFFADGIYVHNDKGDVRSVFKDTAYWNPHVQTDDSGKATVSMTLPDNLTTWVSAAVSANLTTQVGDGKAEFKVAKDIVTVPITPQFLRIGDSSILSGLVHNYTDSSERFSIGASFLGKKLTGTANEDTIEAKGIGQYYWPLTVPNVKGEAPFQVDIKGITHPTVGDQVVLKLPIYEYGSWMSTYTKQENGGSISLDVNNGTDPLRASATLHLNVFRYPDLQSLLDRQVRMQSYGDVDQAAATLIAASILRTNGPSLGLTSSSDVLDTAVNKAIKGLKSTRSNKIWLGGPSNTFSMKSTRSALEGMKYAKDAGFVFDNTLISDALDFVKSYSSSNISETIDQQYIYSLFPQQTFDRKQVDLTGTGNVEEIARGAMANYRQGFTKSTVDATKLLSTAQETPTQYSWYQCPYQGQGWSCIALPTAWSARAVAELKLELNPLTKSLDYLYRNPSYDSQTTVNQAIATIGYYERTGESNPQVSYQVFLGDTSLKSGTLNATSKSISLAFNASQVSSKKSIRIESTGKGKLYSLLAVKEFYTDMHLNPASRNLSIERTYKMSKTPDAPLAPGDLVTVHFHITGLGRGESSVQIEDYVPAGLVPIDESLDNGNFDTNPDGEGSSQEITEQGMKLTFNAFNSASHDFSYKTRVINAGEFYAPPATVKLLNDPNIWARTSAGVLRVDGKNILENLKSTDTGSLFEELRTPVRSQKIPLVAVVVGAIALIVSTAVAFYFKLHARTPLLPPQL